MDVVDGVIEEAYIDEKLTAWIVGKTDRFKATASRHSYG